MVDAGGGSGTVPRMALREAKASFSELVARAELIGQVTVLTKHGRPAAAIVPAAAATAAAQVRAELDEIWAHLDRYCPPGADEAVDAARRRHDRSAGRP